MDHGHIFFYHGTFLDGFGKIGRCLLCPGKNHHTAHIFVQPVNGKNFSAKLLFQSGGNFRFRIQSHGLDTYGDLLIPIENLHNKLLLIVCKVHHTINFPVSEVGQLIPWQKSV